MSGITSGGIRYPDASSRAQNLGAELKRMAEDIEAMFFAEGDSFHKGTLAASHDLNVVLDAGSYGYWAGSPNNPHAVSGVLLVMPMSTNTVQIAYSYASPLVSKRFRSDVSSAWSAWERIDGRVLAPRLSEPGIDADTIDEDITRYSTATNPIANLPEGAPKAGKLTTSVLIASGARPKLQEYVTMSSPAQHWTRFSAAVWSDWRRIDAGAVELSSVGAGSSPSAFKTVPLALTVAGGRQAGATSGNFRMPVNFAAPVRRWRLHFRNNNPRFPSDGPNAAISSVYFGPATSGGQFSGAPTLVASGLATDGGEAVTPWRNTPIEADTQYAVGYSFTAASTNQVVGGGWSASSVNSTSATLTRVQNLPLDVWIEAEIDPDVPVIAAFGDSLSSGISATLPVFDSWLSQYCRQHGALPVHYTASGDSMEYWSDPTHYKWQRWQHLTRPDAVVHAMGSNDVFAAGRTLDEMKSRRAATMQVLADLVSPVIFSATITPRNATTGAQEVLRRSYNTWLKAMPDGARDLFDFVPAISSDDETIRPEFNADGIHLNTAGYAALAGTITRPVVPVAVGDRLDALEQDTGWRNVSSSLAGVEPSSELLLRRVGSIVYVDFRNIVPTTLTNGGSIYQMPARFRPTSDVNWAQPATLSSSANRSAFITVGGPFGVWVPATSDSYSGIISFPVDHPWPTTLPGIPV